LQQKQQKGQIQGKRDGIDMKYRFIGRGPDELELEYEGRRQCQGVWNLKRSASRNIDRKGLYDELERWKDEN
jgi:hypothetical protein